VRARDIGERGEAAACRYLKQNGYKILARNYSKAFGKIIGEIDIIAKKGEFLCFVEVKTRQSTAYGLPSEFVTRAKQQKVIRTAYTYILEKHYDGAVRFDVVEVFHDGQKIQTLRHIPHAFTE